MEYSLQGDYAVSLALFKNVTNCGELKKLAMNKTIDVALIRTNLVFAEFQVLVAANKALYHHLHDSRATHTLHSELLYCLNPSKNISDCFSKFGVGDTDTWLLLAEIHKKGESKMDDVKSRVVGDEAALCDLSQTADMDEVKKVYKVKEEELSVGSLLDAVVTRIASKDIVS